MPARQPARIFALFLTLAVSTLAQHKFTIINNCNATIWPVLLSNPGLTGNSANGLNQGWQANSKSSVAIQVPDTWSGRIWGRQGCNTKVDGSFACLTGDCGALNCTIAGSGLATISEWTLGSTIGDFYDISIVDAFNLPIEIKSNTACPTISCPALFTNTCPQELHGPTDTNGNMLACLSGCRANIGNSTQHNLNCCLGGGTTTCSPKTVEYYNWYHSGCPQAYAYAMDDQSGAQSTAPCPGVKNTDYTVTFCPENVVSIAAPVNAFAGGSTSMGANSQTLGSTSSVGSQTSGASSVSPSSSIFGSSDGSKTSQSSHATSSSEVNTVTRTSGLSHGAVAGIVVGVVALLLLVSVGACLLRRRRRSRQEYTEPSSMEQFVKPYGADDAPAPLAQMGYASLPEVSPQGPAPSVAAGGSSKRALMLAECGHIETLSAPSTVSGSRSAPPASEALSSSVAAPVPSDSDFEERFQARLAQFLHDHMDPPDAQSDAPLPAYPG